MGYTQSSMTGGDLTENLNQASQSALISILSAMIGWKIFPYLDEVITAIEEFNPEEIIDPIDGVITDILDFISGEGDSTSLGLVKEGLGKISGMEYTVTQADIDDITKYLTEQGFIDDYANEEMLKRLQNALINGEKITGADAVFYTHELMEAELVASGVEQTVAHEMALQYYEVSPYSVYHPDVISMEPEWWNQAWFEFWEIER